MRSRAAWLSRGFEELVARLDPQRPAARPDFDIVIVGSGYGGAIAAAELAGCKEGEGAAARKISVCVLERGKEYLSGMFPARLADLPGHVRFSTEGGGAPRGRREGLLDFRIGADVSALIACGLGGGSLINAGVMEQPTDDVLRGWPKGVGNSLVSEKFFARARQMLGAADAKGDIKIDRHRRKADVAKHAALHRLSGGNGFRSAVVTIAMANKENSAGVKREECQLCGDCMTGCNYEAKDSLDTNLLVKARRRGAAIYCGATVLKLARQPHTGLWALQVVYTDAHLRRRQGPALELRARRVILAAGTYGSTEILLRSRSKELDFSHLLGQRYSSNGDTIAVLYGEKAPVRAVADERTPPGDRRIGPTITGVVDLQGQGSLIEELAIPAPLRRAFEEVVTTSNAIHDLAEADTSPHADVPGQDPCAVNGTRLLHSSVLALMGHDGAKGSIELDPSAEGDGGVRIRWPELREAPVFQAHDKTLRRLAPNAGTPRVLPNPMWQLVPSELRFALDMQRGPAFTVHPLGGCVIGTAEDSGVVDDLGRVFKGSDAAGSTEVWPGLVVLDGSIVPSSLGTNPALTIAALALRSIEALRSASAWNLQPPKSLRVRSVPRPAFAPPPATIDKPVATTVEILERMTGRVKLAGREGACIAEITLRFEPATVDGLFVPAKGGAAVDMHRKLPVAPDPKESYLRVFDETAYRELQRKAALPEEYDGKALLRAPLSGTLHFLHREPSQWKDRRCRGFRAYLLNRGGRDIWQWAAKAWRNRHHAQDGSFFGTAWNRLQGALRLSTRAGEVRMLAYDLTVGAVASGASLEPSKFAGKSIKGRKRLTYAVAANPWRQLMQMTLDRFPGMEAASKAVLELDTKYLAHQKVPLLRIVGQQDQPSALADIASVAAYFLRLVLNIHVWSFRRPDAAAPREPQRLPGIVPGMDPPEIRSLELDRLPDGTPVVVRLTRYRPTKVVNRRPIVLIHGYSASGTTFAHPALDPGLARYLYNEARDVWVLDLRTSSGMPTARHPWAFEDAAFADVPAAIDFICRETREPQVDVFAHCMGAAMFSMAVLAPPQAGERFFREREALPLRMHAAVLSQIGPYIIMSPENIFRGYAMSYLRHFLPMAQYDFRVPEDPGLMDQLLDRLLATLPYPEREFGIENPWRPCKRTPFVGTRHRMDALYGRDFSLADSAGRPLISQAVLDSIDDFFGPLSIETVSQAIHFARAQMVTDRAGNGFALPQRFRNRWRFRTMSLHGEENGLADVATLGYLKRMAEGMELEVVPLEGFGHQDCLIGINSEEVFARVSKFLEA